MQPQLRAPALVETEWLSSQLGNDAIRIVDGSWFMPAMKRDAHQEYLAGHIPGAVFFDIDEIADPASGLPHMLPSPEKFSSRMREMGIGDNHHAVVYDGAGGCMAAMRVWWTFRTFGHDRVSVLNGGFTKWKTEGRAIEAGRTTHARAHFTSRFRPELVRSVGQILENVKTGTEQVIDARSKGRFAGAEQEPRPSKHVGHIPGSLNLPFNEIIDMERLSVVRGTGELRDRMKKAGIDPSKPSVTSCGSGVSACVIAFSMYLLGNENVAVYDGSWSEWGNRDDVPVEKS